MIPVAMIRLHRPSSVTTLRVIGTIRQAVTEAIPESSRSWVLEIR
jgi:hypothetical protein